MRAGSRRVAWWPWILGASWWCHAARHVPVAACRRVAACHGSSRGGAGDRAGATRIRGGFARAFPGCVIRWLRNPRRCWPHWERIPRVSTVGGSPTCRSTHRWCASGRVGSWRTAYGDPCVVGRHPACPRRTARLSWVHDVITLRVYPPGVTGVDVSDIEPQLPLGRCWRTWRPFNADACCLRWPRRVCRCRHRRQSTPTRWRLAALDSTLRAWVVISRSNWPAALIARVWIR